MHKRKGKRKENMMEKREKIKNEKRRKIKGQNSEEKRKKR